jgi:hypothetical protein
MMAKKPMAKPEIITPVKSGQTLIQNYAGYGATPTPAPVAPPVTRTTAAQDAAELADLKKQVAEIAAQTGQKVDPRTGKIIINKAATAKKFGVTPKDVIPKDVPGKTITGTAVNADGSVTLTYSDGSTLTQGGPTSLPKEKNRSAFDLITLELKNLGLTSLIAPLTKIFEDGIDDADSIRLALAGTDAYKDRFSANKDRINAGLRSLSPAEYIRLEDQYQEVMRTYGLPASYYAKDGTGKQVGFEKFIAGDVSAVELEDRIGTAQKRVINANPEVSAALKQFYPDITNGDILAYTLDPTKGLEDIKRKVTAAEIGGAAMIPKNAAGQQILTTSEARAMQLAGYGVDKAQATQGYSAIGSGLQRGSQLAAIYGQGAYTQATAEEEVFKLSGQTEAEKQRKKITGLEKAAFGSKTGLTSGALARDRAGGY